MGCFQVRAQRGLVISVEGNACKGVALAVAAIECRLMERADLASGRKRQPPGAGCLQRRVVGGARRIGRQQRDVVEEELRPAFVEKFRARALVFIPDGIDVTRRGVERETVADIQEGRRTVLSEFCKRG